MAGALLGCAPSREDRLGEIEKLQAEGRYQETVDAVMEIFEESPNDPEMMRLYGTTMLAVDIPGLAIWPLRALAEDPDGGVEDHMLLARALRMGGASREAFATIKEVVAADPDLIAAQIVHAGLAIELKDHEATLLSSEAVLRNAPIRMAMAYAWKAKALAGLNRFDEADQVLEAALGTIADRPDIASWRLTFCHTRVEIAEAKEDTSQVEARWEECLEQSAVDPDTLNKSIEFFDAQGNRDRPIEALERAIEFAPNQIELRSRLASRLAAEGRHDEAENILFELTQATNNPAIATRAWLALGSHHRSLDHFEKATEATEQGIAGLKSTPVLLIAKLADDCIQSQRFDRAEELILQIDRPEYVSLLRGRIALAQGNPQKARELLLEGLKLFAGNATARYLAGQAAAQLGDFDLAIEDYRDALRSGPGDSDAPFELARLHEAQGNISGAYHMLGIRQVKVPDGVRVHKEIAALGSKYLEKEDARAAIDRLDALPGQQAAAVVALARLEVRHAGAAEGADMIEEQVANREMDLTRPNNVDVLRDLIRYLGQIERSDEGLEIAESAQKAHPDFAPFHEIHAEALTWANRPTDEIEKAWTHVLDFDPKSALALAGQANLAFASDDIDKALMLFDAADAADPKDISSAWRAIEILVAENREDDLNDRLQKLLLKDPIYVPAVNLLARRLIEDGSNLDRAESLAKRAIRFAGNAKALQTLGLVSLERDENARALRSFILAVQRRPGSPTLRYQLARALTATGKHEEAIEALQKALAVDEFPEHENAQKLLAKLVSEQTHE